jgi:1,4-alpha-glucan branching enzyme
MKKTTALVFLISLLFSCSQPDPAMTSSENIHPRPISHPDWVKDAIIYEVNVRQFTPEGTFEAFSRHLPRLKNLGVDILWLMPIHPIGEVNRKGTLGSYYSVKDYLAVNPEFGTLEDLKALITEVHEMGMHLIIDWVPNHTAWDNAMAQQHPEWYYHDPDGNFIPPIGTDWDDVIALDYNQAGLRYYMKSALKYWVEEVGIDGFRCDVAGYVPTDFWREARKELDEVKDVFLLAEWNSRDCHEAFDMTYAWELEEVMKDVAQGEKNATAMSGYLAKMLNTYPLDYIKMNFTTNHDKNSWEGTVFERFGKAAEVMAVISYVAEGMPLIYSGQEVGLGRALEFFEKDSISWGDHPFNAMYDRLGKLKKDNPSLWNGAWGGRIQLIPNDQSEQIVSFARQKDGNTIVGIFNLSSQQANFNLTKSWFDGEYKRFKSRDRVILRSEEQLQLAPWGYEIYTSN